MNKIGEFGLPSFQTYSKDTVIKPGDLGGGIHRYSKQEKKKRRQEKAYRHRQLASHKGAIAIHWYLGDYQDPRDKE